MLARPADDIEASPLTWLDQLAMPLTLCWGAGDTDRVRRANAQAVARLAGSPRRVASAIWPTDHFGTHLALRDPDHPWYDLLDDMRKATE